MKLIINRLIFSILFLSLSLQADTKIVLLGTGTPVPDYKRAGAGTAVIYNNKAYVFDVGSGVVQNMIEASQRLGIKALYPTNVQKLFITHNHSDHYLDYPALISTYWWRRKGSQLEVYGPKGIKSINEGYEKMMNIDASIRIKGIQPVKNPTLWKASVQEYDKGGWIVKDGDVTIEAFDVKHGEIKYAFGYKITTPDKTIIISGDTRYSENLVKKAKGADVIVHEVISEQGLNAIPGFWQKYHKMYHSTTSDVAKIANIVKPKLLILTHILHYKAPINTALSEVKALYKGKVVLANDLDVF